MLLSLVLVLFLKYFSTSCFVHIYSFMFYVQGSKILGARSAWSLKLYCYTCYYLEWYAEDFHTLIWRFEKFKACVSDSAMRVVRAVITTSV
jgi:hypothetical protein